MRKTSRNEAYLQAVLDGREPPPFNLYPGETAVETCDGQQVVPVKARIPLTPMMLDVCPVCFDPKTGGGLIVEGVCSKNGCVVFAGSLDEMGVRKVRQPRTSLDWKERCYDGQSLVQLAKAYRDEGMTYPAIASALSELSGHKIAPPNVYCHINSKE